MAFISKNWKGVVICMLIARPAWIIGKKIPVMGGPVAGILLGLLMALIPRGEGFSDGIKLTSKKGLQYAIVLLGFDMNFFYVIEVGSRSLVVILSTITAALLIGFFIGKLLKIKDKSSTLISVGTCICGGSAIAATAPCIGVDDEEVANSISTIFLFNIIAAFIFPVIGRYLGMSNQGFGIWAGTAVNDTSSVIAAASAWSSAIGNDTALTLATIVKLTRTLAIVPITLLLSIHTARKMKQSNNNFSLKKVFPWFVLLFLAAAVFNTILNIPADLSKGLVKTGKFIITMAMVGIGLNTNIIKLIRNSGKSIVLGLCCWVTVAIVSIVAQVTTGLW